MAKIVGQRRLQKDLNKIISDCLAGPGSDPEDCNLVAASIAFKLLEDMDLPISNRTDIEAQLKGDNLYERDFLD